MNPQMLNLGCGQRFHRSWTNVDFNKTCPGIVTADLREGIPFADESYVVVYHSHLLEHFPKNEATRFITECHRVLRPKGIIRIAVPDLQSIARNYLTALEKAQSNHTGWDANYDWMLLEMYDQVTRNKTGGEMARYLSRKSILNKTFIIERCGVEARNIIKRSSENSPITQHTTKPKKNSTRKVICFLRYSKKWREKMIQFLLGVEYEALQIGRFRSGGENHQWMYDVYSLSRLLSSCGFNDIVVRDATQSYIPEWTTFNLDTEPDGTTYKPDSIFVEAIKR